MNWQEICNDPLLRELPYKIELNEWGKIVMTPARHSAFKIARDSLLTLVCFLR